MEICSVASRAADLRLHRRFFGCLTLVWLSHVAIRRGFVGGSRPPGPGMAAGSTPSTKGVPEHAHLEGLVRHACGGFFCSSIASIAPVLQGASMVFAMVVLLYYWWTGGEIWYSPSVDCFELGRAPELQKERAALSRPASAHQPPTLWG